MKPTVAARWVETAAVISFGTALILASSAFAAADGLSLIVHDFLDFPFDGGTGPFSKEARWFGAIGGGVFAALCVLQFLVVAPAVRSGDRATIRATIIALLVWCVIDSAGSIAAGAAGNAAFNVLFLALLGAPLVLVKRQG